LKKARTKHGADGNEDEADEGDKGEMRRIE
jgi:hypothetical protein